MPLYPMKCDSCGYEDEILAKSPDAKLPKTCPKCKKRKFGRVLTVGVAHLYWSPAHPRAKRGRG